MNFSFEPIAIIHSDFPSKFAIPRQSGILKESLSRISFLPAFSNKEALRGLETFSHLWLLWIFSENIRNGFNPTVRPPRLGGNKRMGVFATRSPFRPNPIGLSAVKIEAILFEKKSEIIVSGADLMDGTPIVDIKPYIPYTDKIENASDGFLKDISEKALDVHIPEILLEKIPKEKQATLFKILKNDPRPAYKQNDKKIYGFPFASFEIKFQVLENALSVKEISERK